MSQRTAEFCDGVSRRSVIKAGLTGLMGVSLPDILRLKAQAAEAGHAKQDTAIIFLELAGGPAQHETYDPKPTAPAEYRGPLTSISTAVPGVQFSEFMKEQARVFDKLAVIRSIHHDSGSHSTSSHLTQTGYYLRDRQNRENEMPSIGCITSKVRGSNTQGIPAYVSLPRDMRYGRAAWLGKGFNPFITARDADIKNFEVPNLTLLSGLTSKRLQDRKTLLKNFDATREIIDNNGVGDAIDQFTREAFDMVAGDAARNAFDLSQEDEATRDRYGRTPFGQNILLARRLVEHGVTVASVRVTGPSWDDHRDLVKRMREKGVPYDRAFAALVEDLHARGLDKKVMVVAMGEFGRTPKFNKTAGRDHWGRVMSVALAGGGIKTGQVIGSSDDQGGAPVDAPYRPENVLAMLYRHLGIDPSTTFLDHSGRPRYILERRELISELI
ncbi:DUF1501 domain-containing protein [Gimesia sp.]|uniref:DUF1501 domain-containing protein n=1 Tax=Gimesia sp. TaxID=2024833 RepID=UPI003A919658